MSILRKISSLIDVFTLGTFIFVLNILSQKLTNELKDLLEILKDVYFENRVEMEYNQKVVPAAFVKKRIIEKLKQFNGFDGKGYFTLGKPLLMSLQTFLLSYFVILLNFKIVEITSPTPQ